MLLIGQTTGVWTWCGLDPSFSFFIFFVFLHMLSGHRGGDDTRLATELIGNLKSKCVLRYFVVSDLSCITAIIYYGIKFIFGRPTIVSVWF